jgi:hypothetical protein
MPHTGASPALRHTNLVDRMIETATGRSLDQHAIEPVTAAAELPNAAHVLYWARVNLIQGIEQERTALILGDDLQFASEGPADNLIADATRHRQARDRVAALINDEQRRRYAATHPARPVRRRYITPGDTLTITLPHTSTCTDLGLAGSRVRVRVTWEAIELDDLYPAIDKVLPLMAAGAFWEHATGRLYVVEPADT